MALRLSIPPGHSAQVLAPPDAWLSRPAGVEDVGTFARQQAAGVAPVACADARLPLDGVAQLARLALARLFGPISTPARRSQTYDALAAGRIGLFLCV